MEPNRQSIVATHFWHEVGRRSEKFGELHGEGFSLGLLARLPALRRALMAPSPSIRLAVMFHGTLLRVLDAMQTYDYIKLARRLEEYTP